MRNCGMRRPVLRYFGLRSVSYTHLDVYKRQVFDLDFADRLPHDLAVDDFVDRRCDQDFQIAFDAVADQALLLGLCMSASIIQVSLKNMKVLSGRLTLIRNTFSWKLQKVQRLIIMKYLIC